MKTLLLVVCVVALVFGASEAQRTRVRRQSSEERAGATEDDSVERVEGKEMEEGELYTDCISERGNNHKSCQTWWWEWSGWTSCSKTCGGGLRYRTGDRWCNCKTWTHGNIRCVNIAKAEESEGCEEWCAQGSWDSIIKQCRCNDGYYGFCCEIPMKQNEELVDKLRQAQDDLSSNGSEEVVEKPDEADEADEEDRASHLVGKAPVPRLYVPENVKVVSDEKPELKKSLVSQEVHAASGEGSSDGKGSSAGVIVAGCLAAMVALVVLVAGTILLMKARKARSQTPTEDVSIPNPAYEN